MNIFHLGQGKLTTLHELFVEQLRDLYNAEKQLVDALPKMAEAATDRELKAGFNHHLTETSNHVSRLEQIFAQLDESATGKTCRAMEGLIKEGKETVHQDSTNEVKDAALIAAAQRVEHYEIAGYGVVRSYANLMGHMEISRLLEATLNEEAATDKKLTKLSETLNSRIPFGHVKGKMPEKRQEVCV